MDIKAYLNNVCKEIKYEPAKKAISEELELHMKEIKEEYINDGIDEITAEEKAVHQMGSAEEIGKSSAPAPAPACAGARSVKGLP